MLPSFGAPRQQLALRGDTASQTVDDPLEPPHLDAFLNGDTANAPAAKEMFQHGCQVASEVRQAVRQLHAENPFFVGVAGHFSNPSSSSKRS
jgi:hypothetical protein